MEQKDIFTETADSPILSALKWWESRRIAYNLTIGFIGLFLFLLPGSFRPEDILGVIVFAVAANLCYSSGFLIEALLNYYTKGARNLSKERVFLYFIGILISIIVTVLAGLARMFEL